MYCPFESDPIAMCHTFDGKRQSHMRV